mgnify:CR=1 FL=1
MTNSVKTINKLEIKLVTIAVLFLLIRNEIIDNTKVIRKNIGSPRANISGIFQDMGLSLTNNNIYNPNINKIVITTIFNF